MYKHDARTRIARAWIKHARAFKLPADGRCHSFGPFLSSQSQYQDNPDIGRRGWSSLRLEANDHCKSLQLPRGPTPPSLPAISRPSPGVSSISVSPSAYKDNLHFLGQALNGVRVGIPITLHWQLQRHNCRYFRGINQRRTRSYVRVWPKHLDKRSCYRHIPERKISGWTAIICTDL